MPLSPPKIVGGLSTLSKAVRLQGLFPNATITVLRNGAPLPLTSATATVRDQIFLFDPSVTLVFNDKISVRQELPGESGIETENPTLVQRGDPLLAPVFISHVYDCGTSLYLAGIPGAEISLTWEGNAVGSETSVGGFAHVTLSFPTHKQSVYLATQSAPGLSSPPAKNPPSDAPPTLNNASVDPLHVCGDELVFRNVVDGAQLLVRTDATNPATERVYDVAFGREYHVPVPALVAGQKISFQQIMRECQLEGAVQEASVLPSVFADRPVVGPLCAGLRTVTVDKAQPPAILVVKQGTTVIGQLPAYADKGVEIVCNPPLVADDTRPVVVTESLCGVTIDSFPETVLAAPAEVSKFFLEEPLVECGLSVWVRDVYPGASVAIFSDQRGQITAGWVRILGKTGEVSLCSKLEAGHFIHAEQKVCSGPPIRSENVPQVQHEAPLNPPVIETPVFWDRPYVHVTGAQPGARVELYQVEQGFRFIDQAVADWKGEARPSIYGKSMSVLPGFHVTVRQTLCETSGFLQPFAEVIDRTPLQPKIIAPTDGAMNVAVRPQLRWSDPGAGTVRQAAGFFIELTTADDATYSRRLIAENVTGTTFTLGQDLTQGTKYIWRVYGFVGDPGFLANSPRANASFQVETIAVPGPLAFSAVYLFNCNIERRPVTIYKRDLTAGESWQEVMTMSPQYDGSGSCPSGDATPVKIELIDGHSYRVVAVDAGNIGCTDGTGKADPDILACRRDTLDLLGNKSAPARLYSIS
jgi:hypothetical protein